MPIPIWCMAEAPAGASTLVSRKPPRSVALTVPRNWLAPTVRDLSRTASTCPLQTRETTRKKNGTGRLAKHPWKEERRCWTAGSLAYSANHYLLLAAVFEAHLEAASGGTCKPTWAKNS